MKKLNLSMILGLSLLISACSPQVVIEEETPYITVVTDVVTTGIVEDYYTLNGTVSHSSESLVFSLASAEVLRVFIQNGDQVNTGDPLFELDQESITKQLDQTKKSLDLAYVNYTSATDRFNDATATLERNKLLYEQGAISKQQLEQTQLAASSSAVTSARLQYEQTKLQYNNLKDTLEDASIVAQADGVITNLNLSEGDMVQAGSLLCRIIDDTTFKLDLNVSESVIQKLKLGEEASIYIPVIEKTYTGIITEISPTPGVNSKLYPLTILFNGDDFTKSGMYSEVIFDLSSGTSRTRVPSLAILKDNEGFYVFKVVDNQAIKQTVNLGFDNGYFVEVLDGLNNDDIIVVKGQQFIRDDIETKFIRGDQ